MCAHPGNWVTIVKQLSLSEVEKTIPRIVPEASKLIEGIKDIASSQLDNIKLAGKKGERFLDKSLGKIPDLAWAARQDTLDFQKLRVEKYWTKVIRDILKRPSFKDLIKHLEILPEYAQEKYPFNEEIALESLRMTSLILEHIGIF